MSNNLKRKVCVVVNSRANYGRIKSFMKAVDDSEKLDLQLVVGASALLNRFGRVLDIIKNDGFIPSALLYSIIEGETPTTMAKSTGLGIIELSTIFQNLKPDIVLTVADRFETLSTAVAASYMNIPLAHTQGGEVTGSIDESVRHAITKLSHIHFPATKLAAENVIRMGERSDAVHVVGCPSIDAISNIDLTISEDFFLKYKGVGPNIDYKKPYCVVLQHPVTTEYGQGFYQINETLKAVDTLDTQIVWLWPNIDAGSDDISKGLRMYREKNKESKIHFFKNFEVQDYARLISNSDCLIGNSSSAIREGSFLGIPAVNIGTRQNGREICDNIIKVDYDCDKITEAINKQINHGKYSKNKLYGDGNAGQKMAKILVNAELTIQKKLTY